MPILLQTEGVHPDHIAPAGTVLWPDPQNSLDDLAELPLLADEEIEILRHLQSQEIVGIMEQGTLQKAGRSLPFAIGPRLCRQRMQKLAFARSEAPCIEIPQKGLSPFES